MRYGTSSHQPDDFNGYGYFYVRLHCTFLGFQANIVEQYVLLSASLHTFAGLKRTRDQKLSSGLMSGQLNLASLFHFRGTCAVITQLTPSTYCRLPWHVIAWGSPGIPTWSPRTTTCSTSAIPQQCGNSLDVPAPDDCISAINPKMALRPMILPARFQPAWRHSQGVAELGYVCFPRPHGHPEHRRQDVHLPHLQLCSGLFCRGNAPIVSVARCFEHFDHFVGVDRCVYVKANYLHQLFGVGALAPPS